MPVPPDPVTAADVDAVVAAALAALRPAAAADWSVRAGDLTWTCWGTVEHLADDLFVYGAQLAPVAPDRGLPFEADARGPDGPRNTIRAQPEAGVDGLLDVLAAGGAVLAAMVRAAPPGREGFHVFGPADAEASAAMGVLETLVHVHDVAIGLGATWTPDPDPCARVLARLMPDVEPAADPWTTLLWATGRTDLPGRARRTSWRWTNHASAADARGAGLDAGVVAGVRHLQEDVAALPVVDDGDPDDLIGYDEHGLPS